MRIMFCLGSLGKGGAERVASVLANNFAAKNHVSIIVTSDTKSAYELDKSIRLESLDTSDNAPNNVITRTIARARRLKKLIREDNPDLIIAFQPEPTFRVILATLFNKRKIIASVRNDPNVEYNSFLKRCVVKLSYWRVNGFVFQTDDAKRWFSQSIQKRSVIIDNPLSTDFLQAPYAGKRKKEVVAVGRLVRQKNHRLLIDAFNIFSQTHPDYELMIYGQGEEAEAIKRHAAEVSASRHIHFLSVADRISEKIKEASLFMLTSYYEGMPNSLMEALALGVPCVSVNCPCGGPKSLMKGYPVPAALADSYEPERVAAAMSEVVEFSQNNPSGFVEYAQNLQVRLHPDKISAMWQDYIKAVTENNK